MFAKQDDSEMCAYIRGIFDRPWDEKKIIIRLGCQDFEGNREPLSTEPVRRETTGESHALRKL